MDDTASEPTRTQRSTILFVGMEDAQVQALSAGLPEAVRYEIVSFADLGARAGDELAGSVLGCFAWSDANHDSTLATIKSQQALWLLHGVGLCMVGKSSDPHTVAFADELGVEQWLSAGDCGTACRRQIERWLKRESRNRALALRIEQEIEAGLLAQDYVKCRALIDSLVLIDARKRFHLGLLALKMREAKQADKAEECLKRVLIHWPRQLKALALLCEHWVARQDLAAACGMGKQIIDSFGRRLIDAMIGAEGLMADASLEKTPETRRLLVELYGRRSIIRFAEAYAQSAKASARPGEALTVFTAILQETGDEDLIAELSHILAPTARAAKAAPSARAPAAKPPLAKVPAAAAPSPRPPSPPVPALAPLAARPPAASSSDSQLIDRVIAASKTEPDYVTENTGGGIDVVYEMRVFIFHPVENGYQRLAKTFTQLGCRVTEGHHDPGVALDRLRSVKIDALVLWYSEDQPQAVELLRSIVESRDLYPLLTWVLSPSQVAQIQFAAKAHDLFFDGNDVVRWQKAQFEADFKRLLNRAQQPDAPCSVLRRVRRCWAEPMTEPLTQNELSGALAPIRASLAAQPGRLYWLEAEETLQAAARGDLQAAAEQARKLAAGTSSFDAQLVLASVKAKGGESGAAAAELFAWVLAKKALTPERGLALCRLLGTWGAIDVLGKLADALMQDERCKQSPQAHAVCARYYFLGKKAAEGMAHLAKALAASPTRLEYIVDLAQNLDRHQASRAADLWENIAQRSILPRWYCLYQAAEAAIRGEKLERARFLLEEGLKGEPRAEAVARRLSELGKK